MHRRNFLVLTASGLALALTPWGLSSCNSRTKWSEVLAMPFMLGRFCAEEELLTLGDMYLKIQKVETSEDVLIEKLLLLPDDRLFEPASEAELQSYLTRQIENDFEKDDTLVIDGWVISRTEARQCALYSLTRD